MADKTQTAKEMMEAHIKSLEEVDPEKEWEINPRAQANSMANWLPILETAGVLVPRTTLVECPAPYQNIIDIFDGKESRVFNELHDKILEAAKEYSLPLFLRTGQTSHKHGWKDTCYLTDLSKLKHHMAGLAEISCMYDLPMKHWAVREFLELETSFECFYGKMPINKERRYFFYKDRVLCHHAYWPKEAFENHLPPDSEGWHLLEQLNKETSDEIEYLTFETLKVASAFRHTDRAWSVDWAMTKDGRWYCIDMALMQSSYHWPECPVIQSIELTMSSLNMEKEDV